MTSSTIIVNLYIPKKELVLFQIYLNIYDDIKTEPLSLCGGVEEGDRVEKEKLISDMSDDELREHCKKLGYWPLTDEQLKSQRRYWEHREKSNWIKKNNPKVKMDVHPEFVNLSMWNGWEDIQPVPQDFFFWRYGKDYFELAKD